jgi:hypothetical protein
LCRRALDSSALGDYLGLTDEQRQEESDKIAERRDREIEDAVEAFLTSLAVLTDAWNAAVDDFLERDFSRAHPRQLLSYLEAQLSAHVDTSGYPRAVLDLIAAYDGAYAAADEQMAALGVDGSIDRVQLDGVQHVDSSRLSRLASNTALELARLVIASRVLGQPDKSILEVAGRSMDSFETGAGRVAENGIYVFNRAVNREAFRLLDRFKFEGPKDSKNSKFCSEHVGNVYTRDEINHMDNGQPAPYSDVWIFGAHYNCRHQWMPQAEAR